MPTSKPIASTQTARPGELFARVDSAAHEAATSPYSREYPTAEQLEANRYRTGSVDVQGLPLRIETPRGALREKPGKFSNLMAAHYGDIAGTRGNDGDPVDVFVGPFPERSVVYVINQSGADGAFDEHKVMLGFASEAEARSAYLASYSRDWDGLQSIVRATVSQLKWWLKFGDKGRPFSLDVLPYEGQTTMDKVLWNAQAEPISKPLHALMYELRSEDAESGLMLDAVSMADLMTDPDINAMPVLDAMVVEVGRLQPKMDALKRIMEAAGGAVKPTEVSISDPVRYRGVAQVMVLFTMDDGQTVSVWFHNPDTTPAKLMPLDELVSWKWMLNKKDVTIVVAPEKGRDLNPREVARRMMRLVERNSEAFKKANARTAERAAQLQALDTEIAGLETTLADLNRKIEVARVEAEDRKDAENLDLKGFKKANLPNGTIQLTHVTQDGKRAEFAVRPVGGGKYQAQYGATTMKSAMLKNIQSGIDWAAQVRSDMFGEESKEPEVVFGHDYVDYLAAVVESLIEKGGMTKNEANKLASSTNRVDFAFGDKVPAAELADQLLADKKRSPNVERAYRIAERLIAFYGWSKSIQNDYPEMGINLDAPRDPDRWVYLGESKGQLIADKHNDMSFAFDAELSTDAELAANIDLADFEAELDTGVDGLLGSDEEFAGKTVAFAYAAEVLRKGAVAAGATVQFGDFNGSTSASMFDKATNPTPYAEVSVYGITAQIGVDGKVLARASIDEEGKITILKGAGGAEEVGTPANAGDVRELVKMLMAELAAQPELTPAPETTPEPEPETEPAANPEPEADPVVADAPTEDGGEDPIAAVDAAYKFDDATDEFKRWVADSIAETDYSPFASSKAIDEAAKKHGARVSWDIKRVMDSISGEEAPESTGLLDSAASKKIVVDDQVPVNDRPFGVKQVAFVSWGAGNSGAFLVDIPREARTKFGGGTFAAPAGEMPGGQRLVRLDPKQMTMQVAKRGAGEGEIGWTEPIKVKGIKVYNVGKFTGAFRVAALDSVDDGEMVLDAAEGWDSVVGTIKKGAKIAGRAHIGGDGKAMVFVGKSGNTRVKFKSSVDGEIREALWSDDDAPLMVDWLFTEPVNGIAKSSDDKPEPLSRDAIIPAVKYLSDFIGPQQLDTMTSAVRGEEGQWFIDKLVALADQIKGMPGVHGQDGKGNNAIAHLHYFKGGADWYITERDMDGEQLQAFGFADFGASSDLGYINIQELIEKNVELDLHWTPKTLAEIRGQAPDSESDDEAGEAPAVNPDAELPQAMIDGTVNLMDETLADKLEPLFVKYENDPAMMDLLNRAVAAYSDAVVSAAKAALAG